ncbi:MAG: type II/IV secretion system protein [Phycisphaeraceae bacterium]|nr:MAG: type II/IV secretion system protein [Phycisphaeraceae bacterium]
MLDTTKFIIRDLLERGKISDEQVSRATSHAAEHQVELLEALVQTQCLTYRDLAVTRARICEYPFVDLDRFDIDHGNGSLIPASVAEKLGVFPLFVIDGVATVAMTDPLDLQAVDQVRQITRLDVEPVLCEEQALRTLIKRAYSMLRTTEALDGADHAPGDELTTGEEPIVAAVNQIIAGAVDAVASDIHISPDERALLIRYRIDGVLQTQQGPALAAHAGMVQRLKVMAGLDLTQTRKPQDGKFRFVHHGTPVDVRLSVVPTINGENVVLRLLRQGSKVAGIADLGMPEGIRAWYREAIARPHGMILVTGPTGSGKTTTLYAALSDINSPERNIMTIEDPVEIRLPMIRQIQADHGIGLTFASALRSVLRQDPDVVLVGEIRDEETAHIAVQSALTGHLVFSTLHTNDAMGTISRLQDLGVPPYAITNSLLGVIAQRLVRKVCVHCCAPAENGRADLARTGLSVDPDSTFVRGLGCSECAHTGYKGRCGVFEALPVTPGVSRAIETEAPRDVLLAEARRAGLRTLAEDAAAKAAGHITSVEEVLRLVVSVEEQPELPSAEPSVVERRLSA